MDKLTLTSSRGYELTLIENVTSQTKHILIACHGFLGGKENGGWINYLADQLEALKIGVVAFDFEGCGESEGDFADITLSRQVSNLQDVIKYVRQKYKLPIILLGRSFGGSTVIAAASKEEVSGIVLWATSVFLTEVFYNLMPSGYKSMEKGEAITYIEGERSININPGLVQDFAHHDMDKYLEKIKEKPALVIHGTADTVVGLDNCRHIAAHLSNAKVHIVEAADHSFTGKEKLRIDLTVEWLSGLK